MDDFSQPGRINMSGSVEESAESGFVEESNNYIVAGNRPQSSATPIIILNGSTNALVIGASGGKYIISATLLASINYLYFGHSIEEAIESPRIHHQWCPNKVKYEEEFSENLLQELRDRKHRIRKKYSRQLGVVQGIVQLEPPDGKIFAHSDCRKGGVSAGY